MKTEAEDDAGRQKQVPHLFVRGNNYQIGFSIVSKHQFHNNYFLSYFKKSKSVHKFAVNLNIFIFWILDTGPNISKFD